MELHVDLERLAPLCADLAALSGVRIRALGRDGTTLCEGGKGADCCEQLGEGCHRCELLSAGGDAPLRHCHAGLCGAMLPIRLGERAEAVAWLCAGPFLDAPRDELSRLTVLDASARSALVGLMAALADYIRLGQLIQPAGESDLRRLERFLDAHYMEKLSLGSVCAQLRIGRTRLCQLAKELSGGGTLLSMIAQRRIDAAKSLLIQTDQPISAIAEAVGISDYNYFSKIFRAAVGLSPSEFRKRARD